MVAVITDEDHEGLVPKFFFIEHIKHPAELRIHETGACTIGAKQLAPFLIGEFPKRSAICAEAHRLLADRRAATRISPKSD